MTEKIDTSAPISVLLATYNWPDALSLCLHSLNVQTDAMFEVIIADDGSRDDTTELIAKFQRLARFPLRHVWQEDIGFRKAKILNKALSLAQGDYLIFLDGDCLVQPDFIARHRTLARRGHLVTGSRVLFNEVETQSLLAQQRQSGLLRSNWVYKDFLLRLPLLRLSGAVNKFLPFIIKFPFNRFRVYSRFVWRRIKGCNMACWKSDALKIGGFDEALTGWGHEDADFVFRLQDAGVLRTSGAWSTEVLHLHHKVGDKSQEKANAQRVREKIMAKRSLT
jgi:glycosyltransferase involved in cell wall biosynthesis